MERVSPHFSCSDEITISNLFLAVRRLWKFHLRAGQQHHASWRRTADIHLSTDLGELASSAGQRASPSAEQWICHIWRCKLCARFSAHHCWYLRCRIRCVRSKYYGHALQCRAVLSRKQCHACTRRLQQLSTECRSLGSEPKLHRSRLRAGSPSVRV